YCHSPMRYAWDQEHAYFPRRGGPIGRLRGGALTALRAWDVASVPRVDGFWANSHFVARRIRRYYDRDAEVLPPPVEVDAFGPAPDDASGSPYLLAVSALVPYKRLDLAIQSAERLGIELRIVGTGPELSRLRRLAGPNTHLLGRVDDATLRDLYRDAHAFVQPGVEDFGIAAVESLASGTPVVALDRGGVRDIVENSTHGVLYSLTGAASDDSSAITDLVDAIDKSTQIRFNPLDLIRRAQDFSRDRFARRLASSIARHLASAAQPGRPTTEKR
ncbi:MAG: glycosyltransferase, partial [Acidobacteriota bacterium]